MLQYDVRERGQKETQTLGSEEAMAVGQGQEGADEGASSLRLTFCLSLFLLRLNQHEHKMMPQRS